MFYNKKETNIAIFIMGSNSDRADAKMVMR